MKEALGFRPDIRLEVDGIDGDPRLARRAKQLLGTWYEKPDEGFPQIFSKSADLGAAYRFFRSSSVSFDSLISPHVARTMDRCQLHHGETVCIHDTSTFVFNGDREGLGFINKNNRGFLGHFSMVATTAQDNMSIPLGVVAVKTWTREQLRCDKGVSQHKLRESEDCESLRWLEAVESVEQLFAAKNKAPGCRISSPVHLMDREGDIYDSLASIVASGYRCVVRVLSNRRIEAVDEGTETALLFDALDDMPVRYRRSIQVSTRTGSKLPDQRKKYPQREGRTAHVCVCAKKIILYRTRNSQNHFPKTTGVNLVHIFEPKPPENEIPIKWLLYTTEPIETDAQIQKVIELYRQRWLIEEFFKAVKTGCAFEQRQLACYHGLKNALALTIPLAWEMLLFRTQSRDTNSPPAANFVDPLRLQVLKASCAEIKRPLPDNPTLRDVAYAIAGLGGHIRHNGPPGWLVLRRGYDRLLTLEQGWIMSTKTCDQP